MTEIKGNVTFLVPDVQPQCSAQPQLSCPVFGSSQ